MKKLLQIILILITLQVPIQNYAICSNLLAIHSKFTLPEDKEKKEKENYDPYAIIGLITAIVGIILFGLYNSPYGHTSLSIIFSWNALYRIKKLKTGKGKKLSIITIIISTITLGIFWYLRLTAS